MKTHYLTSLFTLFLAFTSCKDSIKSIENIPEVEVVPNIEKNGEVDGALLAKKSCYLYAVDKDSIWFNISHSNGQINGNMRFKFYQIDGSLGTFEGFMEGDTIRGLYDFEAEGTNSKRELIFLKKDGMLVQGKGETELSGNTESFKENASFTFEDARIFESIACISGNL